MNKKSQKPDPEPHDLLIDNSLIQYGEYLQRLVVVAGKSLQASAVKKAAHMKISLESI
jgi:hypothetical protein